MAECAPKQKNGYTSRLVPFTPALPPEARSLAHSMHLAKKVEVQDLGKAVQGTIFWLCLGHALLDTANEEKIHRLDLQREEQSEWELLGTVMMEHREIIRRELGEHDRRREIAAAAIRKYYGQALAGEALFRQMLEKQRSISKTKRKDLSLCSSSSEKEP